MHRLTAGGGHQDLLPHRGGREHQVEPRRRLSRDDGGRRGPVEDEAGGVDRGGVLTRGQPGDPVGAVGAGGDLERTGGAFDEDPDVGEGEPVAGPDRAFEGSFGGSVGRSGERGQEDGEGQDRKTTPRHSERATPACTFVILSAPSGDVARRISL